jgi:hypothetical protein
MKFNDRMSPRQSIVFVIIIAIAVFITMQVVYGQGQVNNSTVAKAKPYSYRRTDKQDYELNLYRKTARYRGGKTNFCFVLIHFRTNF